MQTVIKKYWYIFLIITIGIIFWFCSRNNSLNYDVSGYTNKIDSLQSKIDSIVILRNNIDQKIDTITITIEKTHIEYEKDRNIILSNTTSEDYVFFFNYIQCNKERLDSINNL